MAFTNRLRDRYRILKRERPLQIFVLDLKMAALLLMTETYSVGLLNILRESKFLHRILQTGFKFKGLEQNGHTHRSCTYSVHFRQGDSNPGIRAITRVFRQNRQAPVINWRIFLAGSAYKSPTVHC